mmetsp:Transcript_43021/g.135779  ORF Transcript_43021/g.135779 Transcript_43021/m.135779 type:complete len:340 (-) Transcript_43021:644-1663(-)
MIDAGAAEEDGTEPSFEIQKGSAQIVLKGEDAYGYRKLVLESSDELHVTFVCDGHGGAAAAQLCADKLLPMFIEEARGDGSTASLQRAAARACARLHAEARAASTAGSTLTCIIVHPGRREVTAFNLGDSAAWMVPRDGSAATLLTEDHRLDASEAERERVAALGGRLAHARGLSGEPGGPLRVWPGEGIGGAAQARVVGDARLGDYVDPTPAVTSLKLPPGGADFVVCSDGVWDALPAEAVLATVRKMMRSPVNLARTSALQMTHLAPSQWPIHLLSQAASALVECALNQRFVAATRLLVCLSSLSRRIWAGDPPVGTRMTATGTAGRGTTRRPSFSA